MSSLQISSHLSVLQIYFHLAIDVSISLFSSSVLENAELLKDGLPGALVTALILGTHEIGHIIVAKEAGIKLGVPYFVPSWQVRV